MRLSAAHRKVLLLFLVLLIGVWVGRSQLIDQQPDGQDHPRSAEMQSDAERRTRFPGRGEGLPKSKDNRSDHVRNKLNKASPTAPIPARSVATSPSARADGENSVIIDAQEGDVPRQQFTGIANDLHASEETNDSEPTQEFSDRIDILNPPNESWSASYSLQDGMTQDGPAIEVSPQSMEDDLRRSYEDAGVAPEDIPGLVQNILGMIWPEDPQAPDAYPHFSTQDSMTQDGPAIEVSPESMEDDLRRSYEDAGVAPEDIPGLVQNILGMIWPEDPQAPDAYPHFSTP